MPPEQVTDFRGAQPPADQHATAATLYTLLTAQPLHDGAGTPADLFLRILTQSRCPSWSRPDLPAGRARAIHRALARKPADRFADAAEMRQALPFAD